MAVYIQKRIYMTTFNEINNLINLNDLIVSFDNLTINKNSSIFTCVSNGVNSSSDSLVQSLFILKSKLSRL
jgi:hypothetical protein